MEDNKYDDLFFEVINLLSNILGEEEVVVLELPVLINLENKLLGDLRVSNIIKEIKDAPDSENELTIYFVTKPIKLKEVERALEEVKTKIAPFFTLSNKWPIEIYTQEAKITIDQEEFILRSSSRSEE